MMFALHDRPSEIDAFRFYLATQLGKTLAEIDLMPHQEYVEWGAYFTARHAIEHKTGGSGL